MLQQLNKTLYIFLILIFTGAANGQQALLVESSTGKLTGVPISATEVLTCEHFAHSDTLNIRVDGKPARILRRDPNIDLLILVVDGADFQPVELGDSADLGDEVESEGFPLGERKRWRGKIWERYLSKNFGCTFPAKPGHSGGGVFKRGKLVGLVYGGPDNYQRSACISLEKIKGFLGAY